MHLHCRCVHCMWDVWSIFGELELETVWDFTLFSSQASHRCQQCQCGFKFLKKMLSLGICPGTNADDTQTPPWWMLRAKCCGPAVDPRRAGPNLTAAPLRSRKQLPYGRGGGRGLSLGWWCEVWSSDLHIDGGWPLYLLPRWPRRTPGVSSTRSPFPAWLWLIWWETKGKKLGPGWVLLLTCLGTLEFAQSRCPWRRAGGGGWLIPVLAGACTPIASRSGERARPESLLEWCQQSVLITS